MRWFITNKRPMPWKGEKNPYLIWLSEIILQQTRVEQGLPYYEKFKKNYPTVTDLANAPEDEVMKMWEGLGYYSRARNLHTTAKFIATELNGVFPDAHVDILKLKGVGPYTAAAIASFAYDLPHAVIDGNVYRVLSRYFGIITPIDTTPGKKEFAALADQLIDKKQPGNYNQAIMDFGATHCMSQNPKCSICLLQKKCKAFSQNEVKKFPVKTKKIKKRTRYFNFLVINPKEDTFIRKRIEKDIWQNLYEFPLIETTSVFDKEMIMNHTQYKGWLNGHSVLAIKMSKPFQQQLTHQKIIAVFWEIHVENTFRFVDKTFIKVNRKKVNSYAFPKIIDRYLQDNSLYLELY